MACQYVAILLVLNIDYFITQRVGCEGGGWIEAFGICFVFVYSAVLYTFYSSAIVDHQGGRAKVGILCFFEWDQNVYYLLTCLHIQECEEED